MILSALLVAVLSDGFNTFASRPTPGEVAYSVPKVLEQGSTVHFQSEYFKLEGTVTRAVASQGTLIVTGTTPTGGDFGLQRTPIGFEGFFRTPRHTVFVLQGKGGMTLRAKKILDKGCGGSFESGISNGGGLQLGGPCDIFNTIDVFAPYTQEALQALVESGTVPPIAWYDAEALLRSLIRVDVLQANIAYINSEIPLQLNVRGLHLISEPEPSEDSLLPTMQEGLAGSGPFAELQDIREALRADIVTLISGNEYPFCGVAYLNSDVSQTLVGCLGGFVLAHEVGHNLNCCHALGDGGGCQGYTDSGRGHRFFGEDDEQYRTIMAYSPGTRIDHFSNPNVLYENAPTGIPGEADCASMIWQTRELLSNIRCRDGEEELSFLTFGSTLDECDVFTVEMGWQGAFDLHALQFNINDVNAVRSIGGEFGDLSWDVYLLGTQVIAFRTDDEVPASELGTVLTTLELRTRSGEKSLSDVYAIGANNNLMRVDHATSIVTDAHCPGDLTDDGVIDNNDLIAYLASIPLPDLNCDGQNSFVDLSFLLSRFGQTDCP